MNDITCDSIKEKILLCEELTDAEKEHIAQCEECRAVSLQTEKMISGLKAMSGFDFKDGKIADRVMEEVRKTKRMSFPKFKLSNHVGTAAALVIIVAMFAALRFSDAPVLDAKNASDNMSPVRNVTLTESFDVDAGNGEDTVMGLEKEDGAQYQELQDNSVKMMLSSPKTEKAENEKESDNADSVTYSVVTDNSEILFSSRETTDEESQFESPNAVESYDCEDYAHEQAEEILTGDVAIVSDKFDAYNASVSSARTQANSGGSGGSPGSAATSKEKILSEEEIFEESVSVEREEEAVTVSLFEGAALSEDNSLEENVSVANSYIKAIFETANVLNAATLEEVSVTNEIFLEWLRTVANAGEYSFDLLYEFVNSKN